MGKKITTVLRYPGGKAKSAEKIASLFPAGIKEYREVFFGGGSLYFQARHQGLAESYWVNDKYHDLYCFWKTIQDPECCSWLVNVTTMLKDSLTTVESVRSFYDMVKDLKFRDEFQSAFNFFFLNRVSFSGTVLAGGFSPNAAMERFTHSSIQRLKDMPEALAGVKITNLDFEEVIKAEGKNVFLYVDPPYFKAKKLYGRKGELHDFDHDLLSLLLIKTKHRFLLSYDDCTEVREMYSWAKIQPLELQYSMVKAEEGKRRKGSELIITNY